MSLEFLSSNHSGNAVRDLAVRLGLLPTSYPRESQLGTVLGHVEHELERREFAARWQFATSLQPVARQGFNAADRQALQDWWDTTRLGFTPMMSKATFTVDDPTDLQARLQQVDGFDENAVAVQMDDLRRARGRIVASLDDLKKNEKKQVLWQWLDDVCASGLPAHEQARLIGEFAPHMRGLEPTEVVESAWNHCLGGLTAIAQRLPRDRALNEQLLQIVETFPVLQKVRYPNNPLVILAECREQMGRAGYPEVVSALYLTAARQVAASLHQDAEQSHPAFSNLLRQIEQGVNAGDGIPLQQMRAVLDPVIARSGHAVRTAWEAFLGVYC